MATAFPSPGSLAALRFQLRELVKLTRRTLEMAVAPRRGGRAARRAFAEQMHLVGNRSMPFMIVTMAFIGAIISFQTALQSQEILPDLSQVGATFTKLLVRDLAASVGALPLATRVGAGIAAELGSMVVTEQVDALRMNNADPVETLVLPRFVACVVMGTVVLVVGGFVAFGAGVLVGQVAFGIEARTFASTALLNGGDVALGLAKCAPYGGAIALVSSERGLSAFGGSEGVGRATTEAVVGSCFTIIVLNVLLSTGGHFLLPAL